MSRENASNLDLIDRLEKEKQKDAKNIDGYKHDIASQRELIEKLQKLKDEMVNAYEEKMKFFTESYYIHSYSYIILVVMLNLKPELSMPRETRYIPNHPSDT